MREWGVHDKPLITKAWVPGKRARQYFCRLCTWMSITAGGS